MAAQARQVRVERSRQADAREDRVWPASGTTPSKRAAANARQRLTRLPKMSARSLFTPSTKRARVKSVSADLRRVGGQPPPPGVRRQQGEGGVGEDAVAGAGRELAAFEGQPVEPLDGVHELERQARSQQRRREAHGVEGHVVLGEELHVGHVLAALPPVAPIAPRRRLAPLDRGGDVADGGVEPDIEDLVLEACLGHRHAPFQVAGDATVAQAFVEPFQRDRADERWPVASGREPVAQPAVEGREFQEQMAGRAEFDVGRARDRRARRAKFLGVEQRGAALALIAARVGMAAVRAGADDVAIGQEAPVGRRVGLEDRAFLDEARRIEAAEDILRQPPVGLARGAREMVERQAEAAIDVGLYRMLAGAVVGDRHAGGVRRQLDRRAVLVGAAQEQDLVAGLPAKAGVDVGRQQGSGEIAEMLYAVDVGQRAGDQELAHGTLRRVASGHEKALREEGPERPIGRSVPARQRSAPSCRRGRRIREKASARHASIMPGISVSVRAVQRVNGASADSAPAA